MSQLVPVKDAVKNMQSWISHPDTLKQLEMALPRLGITPERMARIAMTEVRRNPKLALCTVESMLGAVMACAQYGLEPGVAGLAYIIPYGKEATFQLGYRGIVDLLYRSDQVRDIRCFCVFKGDDFEIDLTADVPITHTPNFQSEDDRDVAGAYCLIRTTHGGVVPEYWPREKIEKHRAKFVKNTKRDGPWITDWQSMARKTLCIAASKYAPMSAECRGAIALDELAERGAKQHIAPEITIEKTGEDEPPVEVDPETGEVVPSQEEIDAQRGEDAT